MTDPIPDLDADADYGDLAVPVATDEHGVVHRPDQASPDRDYICPRCTNQVYLRIIPDRRLHFVHRSHADTATCADLRRQEIERAKQEALLRSEDERRAREAASAVRAELARLRAAAHEADPDRPMVPVVDDSTPPRTDLWSVMRQAERDRDAAINRQRVAIDAEFGIYGRIHDAVSAEERTVLEQEWADNRADQERWKQVADAAEAARLEAAVALRPPKVKPTPPR